MGFTVLVSVPTDVCVSETEYGYDPAAMDIHRLKLARAIERILGAHSGAASAESMK